MTNEEQVKEMVKQKYTEIALQDKETNSCSCCGSGGCSEEVYNIMSEEYNQLEGYNPDADLGLGCGLPTQFAKIKKGDTVIDLGSGAGNDCFVARAETGETGKVIGIDFTTAMIEKARINTDDFSCFACFGTSHKAIVSRTTAQINDGIAFFDFCKLRWQAATQTQIGIGVVAVQLAVIFAHDSVHFG